MDIILISFLAFQYMSGVQTLDHTCPSRHNYGPYQIKDDNEPLPAMSVKFYNRYCFTEPSFIITVDYCLIRAGSTLLVSWRPDYEMRIYELTQWVELPGPSTGNHRLELNWSWKVMPGDCLGLIPTEGSINLASRESDDSELIEWLDISKTDIWRDFPNGYGYKIGPSTTAAHSFALDIFWDSYPTPAYLLQMSGIGDWDVMTPQIDILPYGLFIFPEVCAEHDGTLTAQYVYGTLLPDGDVQTIDIWRPVEASPGYYRLVYRDRTIPVPFAQTNSGKDFALLKGDCLGFGATEGKEMVIRASNTANPLFRAIAISNANVNGVGDTINFNGGATVYLSIEILLELQFQDLCSIYSGVGQTCHRRATCKETAYCHVCVCNDGYIGNGLTCSVPTTPSTDTEISTFDDNSGIVTTMPRRELSLTSERAKERHLVSHALVSDQNNTTHVYEATPASVADQANPTHVYEASNASVTEHEASNASVTEHEVTKHTNSTPIYLDVAPWSPINRKATKGTERATEGIDVTATCTVIGAGVLIIALSAYIAKKLKYSESQFDENLTRIQSYKEQSQGVLYNQ